MFKTFSNALKTPEVRKKLLYTLLLIVIFRIGCYITVPGVDVIALADTMANSGQSIIGLVDMISGGAFSRFSLFAMSVTPYITASIIMQLLQIVVPSLEKLAKEGGEVGKAKINRITKIMTIVLAIVEAIGIYMSYSSSGIFLENTFLSALTIVISLVTGTAILMWLGEQITKKGIGNGISMIIFVGIIAGLPSFVTMLWGLMFTFEGFDNVGLVKSLLVLLGAILLIAAVVFVQKAERRIPVQYAKKVVGRKMYGGQSTHIPLKIAMAGVIPIIFASSFMTFPALIIQIFNSDVASETGFWNVLYNFSLATSSSEVALGYIIANSIVYVLLILGFTFFYTYAVFNPAEISSNIKKNGGFIPGIRAGKPTTDHLTSIMTKLTSFGGLYLGIIAILPMFMKFTGMNIAFAGTSILIVVGVVIEIMSQLESQLVMRHYKGFLE